MADDPNLNQTSRPLDYENANGRAVRLKQSAREALLYASSALWVLSLLLPSVSYRAPGGTFGPFPGGIFVAFVVWFWPLNVLVVISPFIWPVFRERRARWAVKLVAFLMFLSAGFPVFAVWPELHRSSNTFHFGLYVWIAAVTGVLAFWTWAAIDDDRGNSRAAFQSLK